MEVLAVISLLMLLFFNAVNGTIRAHGADNETEIFYDEDAKFGPGISSGGLAGYLSLGQPYDGCARMNPPPESADGNRSTRLHFALVKRGSCDFALKVLNAQNAGYQAVIVHNVGSNSLIEMASGLPTVVNKIYIPSIFVGQDTAIMLNASYLYDDEGDPYVELFQRTFNPLEYYLIPFVVVLAVCFFSLLCFLCVKCLRDRRRARRGRLSLQRLKKLPVKKFDKHDEYDVCAICLEDYEEGDTLRILPCKHAYHCKCVDPWLTSSRRICPLCKRRVLSDDESSSSSGDSDSSDDENTPLVPQSDAASPNAPRYGTGYGIRNPFRNRRRFFGFRRQSDSSDDTTSSDSSDVESGVAASSAPPMLTTLSVMRHEGSRSNYYERQQLSTPYGQGIESQSTSEQQTRVDAETFLNSAEALMTHRNRASESSIAILSEDEAEECLSEQPTCSSRLHDDDESVIAIARTPYDFGSETETLDRSLYSAAEAPSEDIIVIAKGSTTALLEEEEV